MDKTPPPTCSSSSKYAHNAGFSFGCFVDLKLYTPYKLFLVITGQMRPMKKEKMIDTKKIGNV
jgi:hypothetical protein